jgi:hypothetical protein
LGQFAATKSGRKTGQLSPVRSPVVRKPPDRAKSRNSLFKIPHLTKSRYSKGESDRQAQLRKSSFQQFVEMLSPFFSDVKNVFKNLSIGLGAQKMGTKIWVTFVLLSLAALLPFLWIDKGLFIILGLFIFAGDMNLFAIHTQKGLTRITSFLHFPFIPAVLYSYLRLTSTSVGQQITWNALLDGFPTLSWSNAYFIIILNFTVVFTLCIIMDVVI